MRFTEQEEQAVQGERAGRAATAGGLRSALRRLGAGAALAVLAAATVPAGAASADARADTGSAHQGDRGRLVSAHPTTTLATKEDVAAALAGAGFDAGTVRFGTDAYRLEYRTVDPSGRPITASGLLMLPRGGGRELRTVSFTHGTTSYRSDAPSTTVTAGFVSSPALTYASAGFAAVAPDYLGLGTGPGPHPWMDVPSETSASLDMLRAARAFVPSTGRTLGHDVLVTGFSQGASAAMGLARALQDGGDRWFRLRAVAPVSGAYDFRRAELPALLGGSLEPKSSVLYSAYLLVAWNRLHHLYDTPGEVFQAPYDSTIEALFDGSHTGPQLFAGTPGTIDALLTPHGFDMLRYPTGRLAEALRVADGTCDWAPRVPVRLYTAEADEQAADANTDACAAALRSHGADPAVVDLGTPDFARSRHLGSNVAGTADIVRWFSGLR
ncbi:alpha/beta hydrolase family protein [Kitasatospora sp. NPDC059577]|uniref:alpha/beta hydrolase family protein n=1 Tax=Kitasatospora sp. NPDC059577 TaxID=3346873 RepID=UPI0036917C7C